MKSSVKSSITLPPAELALVVDLQAKLKAKSKVEVVRRGLRLLKKEVRIGKAFARRTGERPLPPEVAWPQTSPSWIT